MQEIKKHKLVPKVHKHLNIDDILCDQCKCGSEGCGCDECIEHYKDVEIIFFDCLDCSDVLCFECIDSHMYVKEDAHNCNKCNKYYNEDFFDWKDGERICDNCTSHKYNYCR
jgi:hypothetical protein